MPRGIPVLTITTTGARTGQRRTTPLMGVPFGGDIAVIGAHFGQPGTPGWYCNLRAQPRAQVTYRNRTVSATAREAGADERRAILGQARKIYPGYEAYARRITDREIPIMILTGYTAGCSADGPLSTGTSGSTLDARPPGVRA